MKKAQIPCDTILLDQQGAGMAGIPLPEKSFDIVIFFNSLEHLYPLDKYLLEIKRVLKRGGNLLAVSPAKVGLNGFGVISHN